MLLHQNSLKKAGRGDRAESDASWHPQGLFVNLSPPRTWEDLGWRTGVLQLEERVRERRDTRCWLL